MGRVGVIRMGRRGLRGRLKLPKEHGAWAMLYVPFGVGALTARPGGWPLLWLGLAATFLFIARESALAWWRARRRGRPEREALRFLLLYMSLALVFGAPLLLIYRLWGVIPLAAGAILLLFLNAEQAVRREDRTVRGEILAILGLTLTAPAAHYVGSRGWDDTALWLWGFSALYFASSVFYIKWRVLAAHGRETAQRDRARRQCAFYHAFLLVALLLLVFAQQMEIVLLVAFAPALGRALWYVAKPEERVNLKRVGLWEIAHALFFLIFAALAFRSA